MPRISELQNRRQEKCVPITVIDPALKIWIDTVIVPAMIRRWADTNAAFDPRAVESQEAN